LLVHIGDPSSNQVTTLESQMIHMIQELFGQTLSKLKPRHRPGLLFSRYLSDVCCGGQSHRFGHWPMTSDLPPTTDIVKSAPAGPFRVRSGNGSSRVRQLGRHPRLWHYPALSGLDS
jgi:hypothetical protein